MILLRVAAGLTPGGGILDAIIVYDNMCDESPGNSWSQLPIQSRQSMRLRNFARAFLHGSCPVGLAAVRH